jgi:hypothetical protein
MCCVVLATFQGEVTGLLLCPFFPIASHFSLMKEAARSIETLVSYHSSTRCPNPEDADFFLVIRFKRLYKLIDN